MIAERGAAHQCSGTGREISESTAVVSPGRRWYNDRTAEAGITLWWLRKSIETTIFPRPNMIEARF